MTAVCTDCAANVVPIKIGLYSDWTIEVNAVGLMMELGLAML